MKPILRGLVFTLIALLPNLLANSLSAQCSNWTAAAQLTTASICAANGSFSVSLSGPDVAGLSNIQYGIPLTASGFTVPLNNSPNFSAIPPGTYLVSIVANCGSGMVGKTCSITVPGTYTPPTLFTTTRPSLSCKNTGIIYLHTTASAQPLQIKLLSYPATYSGPTSFTNVSQIDNLPPGNYQIQAIDACNTGTTPVFDTVDVLNPLSGSYGNITYAALTCDSIAVSLPYILGPQALTDYQHDTSFKTSIQISGGVLAATPFTPLNGPFVRFRLAPGKTIKDLYGKTISYDIQTPCGNLGPFSQTIFPPKLNATIEQTCNNFSLSLSIEFVCLPVTYTLLNTATNQTYGPYISSSNILTTPTLPAGNYSISYVTGDGYTGGTLISVSPRTANPYQVSVNNGAVGLNNYIDGFTFTTSGASTSGNKTVELFSGPSGYSYLGMWTNSSPFVVTENQSPSPSTLKFPPGTYVWKITDECGVYYLSVTADSSHLYQFTVGTPSQQLTCQGLWITPNGTSTNLGKSQPIGFSVLINGSPYLDPLVKSWLLYPLGTPILLNRTGTYTIIPSSATSAINLTKFYVPPGFQISYPNLYTSSYTFTYTADPLAVDMNLTQGFSCKGALPGTAEIYAAGKGGIPFQSAPAPHYNFSLALPGNGASGPYIANNTSGVFTSFGGNPNSIFDLKITDSCGAFVVQPIKILDLGVSRLATSSTFVGCENGNVQLNAVYLPKASYSWTGPNGFTSNLKDPVINKISAADAGVYRVTIITGQCSNPVTDSTTLVIIPSPPKPIIDYSCLPKPTQLYVTNASPGLIYKWDIGFISIRRNGPVYLHYALSPSETPWTTTGFDGSFAAVAIDSNGCSTKSDSLVLYVDGYDTFKVSIYTAHTRLCPGDTATLIAKHQTTAPLIQASYQWFRNGIAIPGATSLTYATTQSGAYRVYADAGPCSQDTSAVVYITSVPHPIALISASDSIICAGDTATVKAYYDRDYTYTWYYNGSLIPGDQDSAIQAAQTGSYHVIVSNNGCISISPPQSVRIGPGPAVSLAPVGIQGICPGNTLMLSTAKNKDFIYTWLLNGSVIPGADSNSFKAAQPGRYEVQVSTAWCKATETDTVIIELLPNSVDLGPDTTNCTPAQAIQLSLKVDSAFSNVIWSTGENSREILVNKPGTFWVRVQNSCGIFADTMQVRDLTEFLPGLPDDTLICNKNFQGRISIPSALSNIRWSNGKTTSSITVDTPGIYWVEGFSPCGMLFDTINVRFCKPMIRNLYLSGDSLCAGDCVQVEGWADDFPQNYQWIFQGGSPATSTSVRPGTVCYSKPGIYPIVFIVSNVAGSDTAYAQMVVSEKPEIRFRDTFLTVPYKTLVNIPACADAQVVDWYHNDTLICSGCASLPLEGKYYYGVYKCVVRNARCPDSCNYVVRVVDIPNDVWLPDAFTPNGDGRNDLFHVITDNPNIQVVNLDVFNRWGQRVFRSNLNNDGWNGTFNGRQCDGGTYFWQLRYRIRGAEETVFFKKGDLVLIK